MVILGIIGAFLVAFVLYITLRLKRRQSNGEDSGPYQGTVMHSDHPAAQITPFAEGNGRGAGHGPKFHHNPGEDMRIALRRPDGAWHFADSRTPFTPAGVSDIDVLPSPMSSSTSLASYSSRLPLKSKKSQEARTARDDFELSSPIVAPPPAYHEPCQDHFDETTGRPPT